MKRVLLPIITATLLVAGCKNKDEEVLPDPHHNSVLSMAMHWWFGTEAFSTDSLFTDDFSHAIEVDSVRFYLGNPWFNNDAGDSITGFVGKYFLIDAAEGALIRTIGEVDAHLHEMNVDFGLDSMANFSDIATAAPPLDDAGMLWAGNGRWYARINGKVDSDADGTPDLPFTYDLGSIALLHHVTIEVHTDADIGSNVIMDLDVDVQRMLQGVDLLAQPVTHTTDAPVLAAQLMDNLSASITYP